MPYLHNDSNKQECGLLCLPLQVDQVNMKAVLEDQHANHLSRKRGNGTTIEAPMFLKVMLMGSDGGKKKRIGMINMDEDDIHEWGLLGDTVPVQFDRVSGLLKWKDLFPEWIDEEEESNVPQCPEIPMPELKDDDGEYDLVVVKVPCKYPEDGWNRDVVRLQMHLVAANVAVRKGARRSRRPRVVIHSRCQPMIDIFQCDDLVTREGDWWVYEPDVERLREKVSLPVGSCRLALPLWGQGTQLTGFVQQSSIMFVVQVFTAGKNIQNCTPRVQHCSGTPSNSRLDIVAVHHFIRTAGHASHGVC